MYIDAHVHLRDFKQQHKETIAHGLEVAADSGLDAVFDMPNTDPAITTRDVVVERLALAREAAVPGVFYGMYIGLTADQEQVRRAVDITRTFPQAIGMKLYAGHSVGNLGVTGEEEQQALYETLAQEGYTGVLAVHCEKESAMEHHLWKPSRPITHCHARPEWAEVASVYDQLRFAEKARFPGKLHIAHISSPGAVALVAEARQHGQDVSCGVCPHHLIYDWGKMREQQGILWKMNPPLREPQSRDRIFHFLREGKIDWIETDHAPHSLDEKMEPPYLSGIPGIAWWPLFAEYLRQQDFPEQAIERVTFSNIAERFGLDVQRTRRMTKDRRADYPFDPYRQLAAELGQAGPARA